MAEVDHIWSGWRQAWVSRSAEQSRERRTGADVPECILCALADKGKDHYVLARNDKCFTVMNLYPYTNGHMMVVPLEHHQNLDDYSDGVRQAVMDMTTRATATLRNVYQPDGINVGINIGEAAGAGVPGHLHVHVLPRWIADAGFVTATANARTLPETLESSYERLWNQWDESERI
jgi:ATP adenylyltransferase